MTEKKDATVQLELYTTRIEEYKTLFTEAFGFEVIKQKPGWICLSYNHVADLMFFDSEKADEGESYWEFTDNESLGKGMEIVLITYDIEKVKNVVESHGYSCSPYRRTPWGSIEFLFRLKEGYLIRVKQQQLPIRKISSSQSTTIGDH